jgi:hypothetical protein
MLVEKSGSRMTVRYNLPRLSPQKIRPMRIIKRADPAKRRFGKRERAIGEYCGGLTHCAAYQSSRFSSSSSSDLADIGVFRAA